MKNSKLFLLALLPIAIGASQIHANYDCDANNVPNWLDRIENATNYNLTFNNQTILPRSILERGKGQLPARITKGGFVLTLHASVCAGPGAEPAINPKIFTIKVPENGNGIVVAGPGGYSRDSRNCKRNIGLIFNDTSMNPSLSPITIVDKDERGVEGGRI